MGLRSAIWPNETRGSTPSEAAIHRTETGRVTEYTFGEFDDRTNRIANGLRERGVDEGTPSRCI